jgi:CubicO group peptidase (beta-lactamase class C family)
MLRPRRLGLDAAGDTPETFLREWIFAPLGMKDSAK